MIPPGKVLYLGEFVVTIVKKEFIRVRGNFYTYNLNTIRNRKGLDSIARMSRERYPELSGHFKNDAEIAAPRLLNESFHSFSYRNG